MQPGAKTATGLGNVGVMVNGVGFFNALDAQTYQNDNTWHQIANVFEATSFDTGPGHPARKGMQLRPPSWPGGITQPLLADRSVPWQMPGWLSAPCARRTP